MLVSPPYPRAAPQKPCLPTGPSWGGPSSLPDIDTCLLRTPFYCTFAVHSTNIELPVTAWAVSLADRRRPEAGNGLVHRVLPAPPAPALTKSYVRQVDEAGVAMHRGCHARSGALITATQLHTQLLDVPCCLPPPRPNLSARQRGRAIGSRVPSRSRWTGLVDSPQCTMGGPVHKPQNRRCGVWLLVNV